MALVATERFRNGRRKLENAKAEGDIVPPSIRKDVALSYFAGYTYIVLACVCLYIGIIAVSVSNR